MKYKVAIGNLTMFEANALLKHLVGSGYGVGEITEDASPTGRADTTTSSSVGLGRKIIVGGGAKQGRKDHTIHVVDSNTHFKSLTSAVQWLKDQGHRTSTVSLRKAIRAGERYCGHLWELSPNQPINEPRTI